MDRGDKWTLTVKRIEADSGQHSGGGVMKRLNSWPLPEPNRAAELENPARGGTATASRQTH